jgi:hypothetical protein
MKTFEPRRLTAQEMRELEGLAFHSANRGLLPSEQRRYEQLRGIEESLLRQEQHPLG